MAAEESRKFWDTGCWLPLLSLALCILCVTGFALLNQLNLLFTSVTFGFGLYCLSGACWFSYKGLKEFHRIRKQKGSKPWENDSYVVQKLARPLPISKSLMVINHPMDSLSPEPEHKRFLKFKELSLAQWQKHLLEGLAWIGVEFIYVPDMLDDLHKITYHDTFGRVLLCLLLVMELWMFVNISDVLIRQVIKQSTTSENKE